eukprot:GHUV01015122.1.p1 GENE.GHUV01015122.1~~GHUV01015122.1.p1  ORF type:complete len:469 (+),score=80.90 GHUV01015122.1:678-2084(+)
MQVLLAALGSLSLGDRIQVDCSSRQYGCSSAGDYVVSLAVANCIGASADLMPALPAATLTELRLAGVENTVTDEIAVAAHISQLRNLRHLDLSFGTTQDDHEYAPDSVVDALSGLTRLQSLRVFVEDAAVLDQLPRQLHELEVGMEYGKVDLTNLTTLRRLVLSVESEFDEPPSLGSKLPTQLEHLQATDKTVTGDSLDRLGITNLRCLQTVSLNPYFSGEGVDAPTLKFFMGLQQLSELHLRGQNHGFVVDTSHLWPLVANLHTLDIEITVGSLSEIESAVKAVAAAKSLKALGLELYEWYDPLNAYPGTDAQPVVMALCGHIARLTGLDRLDLKCYNFPDCIVMAEHDALHLTALTNLTRLQYGLPGGIDDGDLCALASVLAGLQELVVDSEPCNLIQLTTAPLAVINTLHGLRSLELSSYSSTDAQIGLGMLTNLHQLMYLSGFQKAGRHTIDAFWSVVHPKQQS